MMARHVVQTLQIKIYTHTTEMSKLNSKKSKMFTFPLLSFNGFNNVNIMYINISMYT